MPQNSHQANFRGRSFRGKNLSGADFSFADIRGADFSNAILTGANFCYVKAGLQKRWIIGLVTGILILTIIAGAISAYAGATVGSFLLVQSPASIGTPRKASILPAILTLLELSVFLIIALHRGLGVALGGFAAIAATVVGITLAIPSTDASRAIILVNSSAIALAVAGALLGAVAVALAIVVFSSQSVLIVEIFAVIGVFIGSWESIQDTPRELRVGVVAVTSLIAVSLLGLSAYMGWHSIAEDKRYSLIRSVVINLCTIGGTSFQGANLTDANFYKATLRNADLRKANLTRTCWFQAKYLKQARIEGTYLENAIIRQIAILKNGQSKNLNAQDLQGLNLQGGNLADATLIGANLSNATLQYADLSRAKLVKSQLYQTNFTYACLTGAFIQDWAISTDTKLDKVRCEYIYTQLPTKDDPDPCRKPDNRNEIFKEGDFSDFIAPIVKTLDLYRRQNVDPRRMGRTLKSLDLFHHEGIDPSVAAIALKQLAEQYPEAGIEVVALEGMGDEKIRVQARVTRQTDRSKLSAEYFEKYRELSSLPYTDLQALLTGIVEKDERIRSLERMVMTAIETNKFYIETYYNLGDTMSEDRSISITSGGGNISGIVGGDIRDVSGVVNLGAISGDVSNVIGQLPESSESDKPSLKELLTQLQVAIEAESALSPEDKAEALEQIKKLAEAGQAPEDSALQKTAKGAIRMLKGLAVELPTATKLVEGLNGLLPLITHLLGL